MGCSQESSSVLELPFEAELHLLKTDTIKPDQLALYKRYHGFNYTQVCRGRRSSIYRQMYDGKAEGFEVFIIHIQKETLLYGKICKTHERWPKDGDFGKSAWTCWTEEEALIKHNELEKPLYTALVNQ